jgi:hypothetical protein
METWPIHIQCLMTILHLFSIETAHEPSVAHIIHQTIITFRYKNLIWCSWDHRLVIFHNRTNFSQFWEFKYLVFQSWGFDPPCTPSFFPILAKCYLLILHTQFISIGYIRDVFKCFSHKLYAPSLALPWGQDLYPVFSLVETILPVHYYALSFHYRCAIPETFLQFKG